MSDTYRVPQALGPTPEERLMAERLGIPPPSGPRAYNHPETGDLMVEGSSTSPEKNHDTFMKYSAEYHQTANEATAQEVNEFVGDLRKQYFQSLKPDTRPPHPKLDWDDYYDEAHRLCAEKAAVATQVAEQRHEALLSDAAMESRAAFGFSEEAWAQHEDQVQANYASAQKWQKKADDVQDYYERYQQKHMKGS